MISRLYLPHIGGVEKHISRLSALLPEYDIQLITERYDLKLKKEEKIDNVYINRIYYPKIKIIGLLYIWIQLSKKIGLIYNADIVHIHDVFIWYFPFRLFFLLKKTYITYHGWEGVYPIPIKNRILKKLSYFFVKHSIGVGKYIEEYFDIKCSITVIGAVDEDKARNMQKRRQILYVGRLSNDTGLNIIFDTISKLKNKYKIVFCGEGELEYACKKYGTVLSPRDAKYLFAESSICFCSGYLTILEAMFYKCLVIAAYHNPLKKYYYRHTPFSKYIILSNKPYYLKNKIKDFMDEPNLYKKRLIIGSDWAKEQSWKKLTDIYKDLWADKL